MIDFACQKFDLNEIIRCGLGLTKTELNLLFLLIDSEWHTAEALGEKTNISLSTIQRSLKTLHEKDLIERRQQNLDRGGYLFVYRGKNKDHVKSDLRGILGAWMRNVEDSLSKW